MKLTAQQRKVLQLIEGGRPIEAPRLIVHDHPRGTLVHASTFRSLRKHGFVACADRIGLRWYITDEGRRALRV